MNLFVVLAPLALAPWLLGWQPGLSKRLVWRGLKGGFLWTLALVGLAWLFRGSWDMNYEPVQAFWGFVVLEHLVFWLPLGLAWWVWGRASELGRPLQLELWILGHFVALGLRDAFEAGPQSTDLELFWRPLWRVVLLGLFSWGAELWDQSATWPPRLALLAGLAGLIAAGSALAVWFLNGGGLWVYVLTAAGALGLLWRQGSWLSTASASRTRAGV